MSAKAESCHVRPRPGEGHPVDPELESFRCHLREPDDQGPVGEGIGQPGHGQRPLPAHQHRCASGLGRRLQRVLGVLQRARLPGRQVVGVRPDPPGTVEKTMGLDHQLGDLGRQDVALGGGARLRRAGGDDEVVDGLARRRQVAQDDDRRGHRLSRP